MATSRPPLLRPAAARSLEVDWILLAIITTVCLALSYLQWRWTGEFARAERVRLQAVLAGETQRVAQSFDETLRANCLALMPSGSELRQDGAERVHLRHFAEWRDQAENSALFQRIAVAIPSKDGVGLFGIDGGTWRSEAWPSDWAALEEAILRRWRDRVRPPLVSVGSDLIEMPVFAQPGGEDGEELEWMIFEVDREYVRRQLMPSLVQKFLNPSGDSVFDAALADALGNSIFGHKPAAADAQAEVFPLTFGPTAGRGRGRGGPQRVAKRWTLYTWHSAAGSLDDAVAGARRRNLAVSLVLIAILGASAWALVRYTARGRRLAQSQMEFVAGVSHDLRTPLAAIRGAAFNIQGGLVKEPDALDRYGQLILRNAEDLTGMVENLLAFAALKKNMAGNTRAETVDLEELIRRAAASIEHELASGQLEVEIDPATPPVSGDSVALERAIRNLLENAARHGADGRWIGVSVRPEGSMVELRVQDRGPGISPEDMPRIFEAFYSGEGSHRAHVRGTGLGLSLVKQTVEALGGTVQAVNRPSGGAEFVVRLPAAAGVRA